MQNQVDPTDDWNQYSLTKKRIVAFVDILGFTNAVMSVRLDEQFRLGSYFMGMQFGGAFGPEYPEPKPPRADMFRARATSFSDCCVFSFPFGVFDTLNPGNPGWPIDELASKVGKIFHNAFQIGCLIRGGIAIGHLAHDNQIVLGPGLIEAYHLESNVAVHPRIILSDEAARHFGSHPLLYKEPTVEGEKSFTCLNFVKASKSLHRGDDYAETIMRERVISTGVLDGKAMAKWAWLNARLNAYLTA